jgi:3'-phosphoadenosine 5'-phosphosulfate sulfotransferase (PAPS reductase)/FAD synthetase
MDTALLFSGGKDSLACLYLNKHRWDEILVIWVNTGAIYPEMQEYMDGWKKKLPLFWEVKSNQPEQVKKNGWPVDVLPINNTELGQQLTGESGPLLQPYLSCCAENIWIPLHTAVLSSGVKYVIKGQRVADGRKSTSRNGSIVDGVEYQMPIEDWSDEQVMSYLKEVGAELAPGYKQGEKTGRDCWDCTAYLDENKKRIENLPEERKLEIKRRLGIIKDAIDRQWSWNG